MKSRIKSTTRARVNSLAGVALALIAVFSGHLKAQAAPVSYTFSSVGTGNLGASPFNNASFTITSTADTSQILRVAPGIFRVLDLTATVFVSGVGSGTFNISTMNVDNQNLSSVGFSDPTRNLAILFVSNPAFATYDLSTSIGPLSGPPTFNRGLDFGTTAGNFSLTAVSDVTFQASVVPEPGTYALAAFGLAVLSCWRRRY